VTGEREPVQLACGRRDRDGSLIIDIRVQARSSRLSVGVVENGRLRLYLTAPPVDGKANQQAARLLAKQFNVSPSNVALVRGPKSRDKSFRITGSFRIPPAVLNTVATSLQEDRDTR